MKKVFLLLCLMATTTFAMATDLWEGTHAVDWSNTLTIEADKFADAQVGQKIVIEFTDATGEVIELHSNGGMLPGTRYAHCLYGDQHETEVFITPDMLACLKEYGMEVCGKGFTATKLWYGDGKDNVEENTVWTGYYWMDEWSTMELAKTSFDGINWSNYKAIRFYSEADRTDYVINVLTKWGDDGKLGDQTTMTMTNEYAELSLENIDMSAKMADTDRLMVQCNKEGGNPFNFTAIVLVKKESTGIATDLWEGTHAVDWSNTLTIEADKFADAQVGQKIVIEFTDATGEVIELHSNGGMLPGTRYAHCLYGDQHETEVFITPDMLACLKEYGMEVCGKGFTATKLWYGDGKDNVEENTVWTGYYWMDEWSTMELAKTSFDGINWSNYKAIRFYSEADRTDYVINVLTKWGDDGKLGDQTTMTMTNEYAELSLENIDMSAKMADTDRLMVQCNKEGGNPFNFTAIVLVKKENTGIDDVRSQKEDVRGNFYNLAGQRIAQPIKGLYIVNGRKFAGK